jgi:cysteine-rich repeat protein
MFSIKAGHGTCGDGVIDSDETCDDHNTAAGDGCDTTCHTETGYTCSGMPSTCIFGGTCDAPFPLTLTLAAGVYTGTGSGDTTDATDGFHAAACDSEASSGAAPDQTWTFTNPIAQPVLITVQGATTSFDAAVRMTTTACDIATEVPDDVLPTDSTATADGCADLHGSGTSERLSYNMLPAGTYYITIDGYQASSVGTYTFTIAAGVQNTCGNGVVETGETCDDGNTAAADGCSATCQVEATYTCSGEPSSCHVVVCGDGIVDGTEQCDSNAGHQFCDASCHLVFDTTDTEVNNTGAAAQVITPVSHIIEGTLPIGDRDIYTVTLTAPSILELETYTTFASTYAATTTTSPITNFECNVDTELRVFASTADPTLNTGYLYYNDDGGEGACSYIAPTAVLAAGTYFVEVNEYNADDAINRYLIDFKVTPM